MKSPSAAWVKRLPWHTQSPRSSTDDLEPAPAAATLPPQQRSVGTSGLGEAAAGPGAEFQFGFDNEVMLPYRTRGNGTLETGLPLTADAAVQDGWLVAEWPDGMKAPIEGMTAEKVRQLVAARTARPSTGMGELWSSTHCISKNHVCLKQKVDHYLLLFAFEQKNPRLRAAAHVW